jgi:hypothetical protein
MCKVQYYTQGPVISLALSRERAREREVCARERSLAGVFLPLANDTKAHLK